MASQMSDVSSSSPSFLYFCSDEEKKNVFFGFDQKPKNVLDEGEIVVGAVTPGLFPVKETFHNPQVGFLCMSVV